MQQTLTIADLDRIVLQAGAHRTRGFESVCVMEAVAWLAGRDHSDRPPCVSTVIGDFLRSWNDAMNDEDRQQLKALIPKVIGTAADPEIEMKRSYMALDWYCRVSAPGWLRLAGLTGEADAISACAPIVDRASAKAAQQALNRGREAAAAARDAAWAAAWAAAGDAAGDAAWAAASAAARDAASAAARDAARDAAWDAASAAAWDAARDAASAAAWDAASAKLRPTVEELQKSAIALVERMCEVKAA